MLLGIESSCDESALALFSPEEGLIWESVWSQIQTHARHGGVVPELAVREHLRKFPELIAAMPVPLGEITKVAVTVGPGLVGSLAMGMSLAKAVAMEHGLPLMGVNHLRAHAWSVFLRLHKESPENFAEQLARRLPHLGLLVSGGNTILYEIGGVAAGGHSREAPALGAGEPLEESLEIRVLARTLDDAAGEALDKAAKMLGLPYPGGPMIEKLAKEGDAGKFEFPIPFKEKGGLGFSFSGLKTAIRYKMQAMSATEVEAAKSDLAASFQRAVVESLTMIIRRAMKGKPYRSLGVCGGVAQNGTLRVALGDLAREAGVELLAAEPRHCGDNAAMIAFAAWVDPAGLREVGSFEPGMGMETSREDA